ncbi:MAG: DUF4124 domain-containing protein [Betaproteobacteria bacterium]|nr:DUF4124 domain-containing protein [Betaproteobacteria bacterium]
MSRLWLMGFSVFVVLSGTAVAQQKLYRWTDADGRVFYTDRVPPGEARNVERKALGDRPGSGSLPYDLQRAMKLFPVTVYASDCGTPCDSARKLLESRGVPYTEKDARDPVVQAEIRGRTGSSSVEVPILIVGQSVTRGWEAGQWNAALDAADYPRASRLPPGVQARSATGSAVGAPGASASGNPAGTAATAERPTSPK